jgi:ribosomal protein S18 acetylase RimI-like enzyme
VEIAPTDAIDDVREAWLVLAATLVEIDGDLAPAREDTWAFRRAQYARWLLEHPANTIIVARDEDRVLGYAMLRVTGESGWRATSGPYVELETLSVLPEARGREIGGALWNACVAHLQRHVLTDVTVTTPTRNEAARRFYERAGFVPFSSGWWLSPVPDWPQDTEVVPVEDLDVIRPLHRALGEHHAAVEPPGLSPQRPLDAVWERHENGMLREGILLRHGELGFVHATVDETGWAALDTGPLGHIEMLAVSPEARGRGIGARLLHAGARATGRPVVTLDVLAGNRDAERFYAREGFRRVTECLYRKL